MSVHHEWVQTASGLERLREEWTALDGGGPGAVFRSWEWHASWWRALGDDPRRGRALRVLVLREGGRAAAILPLYVEDAPAGARRLRFTADGVVGSDYLGLVAAPEEAPRLARLAAARLAGDPLLADVDLLHLTDLVEDDPLAAAIEEAGGWLALSRRPRYVCPHARLGEGRERYLAGRANGFGGQLRDRTRRLAREPGHRLEILERPDEVVAGLDHLFTLHRRRFAGEGGSQAIPDARVEEFHRLAARRLAERGFARLALLSARGRPIAAGYGFARAGVFAYYQAGIDPDWKRLSAGTVVLGALLERAFAEGIEELDFLHGEETYKGIWATDRRRTIALTGHRAGGRASRALALEHAIARLRGLFGRHLPAPAKHALRRLVDRCRRPRSP